MPDFTSALYLGLRHPAHALRPWGQLTAGVPSALREAAEARHAARRLAALIGCESAGVSPSTLHLFWDMPALLGERSVVLLEEGTYAVGRWGAERAGATGSQVVRFPHHSPRGLQRVLLRLGPRRRALIVADGVAPGDDARGPLKAYARLAERYGAALVIDDTQTLGVLGGGPDRGQPYGYGGGGSLRHHDLPRANTLMIASLAKALGVPLAVLAGPKAEIAAFSAASQTRIHLSPPSTAALRSAHRALSINRAQGDELRARLRRRVRQFQAGATELGLAPTGDDLPVQALPPVPLPVLAKLRAELDRRDVVVVAQRLSTRRGRLCFLISARHAQRDVAEALVALDAAYAMCMRRRRAA
jgi:8-amino-7-oxononanoate synthase